MDRDRLTIALKIYEGFVQKYDKKGEATDFDELAKEAVRAADALLAAVRIPMVPIKADTDRVSGPVR